MANPINRVFIGKSNSIEHRSLVESFLESSDYPMLARLALEILCDWWGLREQHQTQLLRFVKGVDWDLDDGGFVRLVAISQSGDYLRHRSDPHLDRALLDLYDDEYASDVFLKGVAYAALARATGKAWNEIPRAHHGDWRPHIDQSVVQEAPRRTGADQSP